MEGVALIALNIIFGVDLYNIKRKINSSKINKKNTNILYYSIIIAELLIYIVFNNIVFWNLQRELNNDTKLAVSNIMLLISPYFWTSMAFIFSKIFYKIRINKNRKLHIDKEYIYYREILSKISPSIISFISTFTLNLRKDISATILKLKLEGYIEIKDNMLYCTEKDYNHLLKSEQMILSAISGNKFNTDDYYKTVKNETFKMNYLKEDKSSKLKKVFKSFKYFLIPVLVIGICFVFMFFVNLYLDKYYPLYVINNVTYVKVTREQYEEYGSKASAPNATVEEKLKAINERFQYLNSGRAYVNGNYYVNLNRFQPLNYIYSTMISIIILLCLYSFIPAIVLFINRLKNLNSDYIRTAKGIEIANNAYGLKNYLETYSLIENKKSEDLILFEYYLVYAVSLGVNVCIESEIINKFISTT